MCRSDTAKFREEKKLCESGILVGRAEHTGGTEYTGTEAKTTQRANTECSCFHATNLPKNLAHLHLLNMKLFQNTFFKCYFMFPLGKPLLQLVSKM